MLRRQLPEARLPRTKKKKKKKKKLAKEVFHNGRERPGQGGVLKKGGHLSLKEGGLEKGLEGGGGKTPLLCGIWTGKPNL